MLETICPQTLDLLAARGVAVHVLQTEEAVKVYNVLQETLPFLLIFHSNF